MKTATILALCLMLVILIVELARPEDEPVIIVSAYDDTPIMAEEPFLRESLYEGTAQLELGCICDSGAPMGNVCVGGCR